MKRDKTHASEDSGHNILNTSEPRVPDQPPKGIMERDNTREKENPVHKVFNTSQLCERILRYLPFFDLKRSKRVCRGFGEVIDWSLVLQENLFLRARLDNVLCATLTTEPSRELLIRLRSKPDSHATKVAGEVIIYEQHPAFPQIWCPSVGRRTHLVEHVGATILATRKARLDSFRKFDYIGSSGVHKFLKCLAQVGPNAEKTYICQPPIQDFRITYSPSSPAARTIFVDIHEVEGITFGVVQRAARRHVESIEPRVLRPVDPSEKEAKSGSPRISFGFSDGIFFLDSKSHRRLQRWTPGKITWGERQAPSGAQEKIVFSGQLSGKDVERARRKRNEDHFA
jgi:hypothetical protein